MNTTSVNLKGVLLAPDRTAGIPEGSKWLGGEGAGSWFHFEEKENQYFITRYSPEGNIECSSRFKMVEKVTFDLDFPFEMDYLSHCSEVNVKQNNKVIKFVIASD